MSVGVRSKAKAKIAKKVSKSSTHKRQAILKVLPTAHQVVSTDNNILQESTASAEQASLASSTVGQISAQRIAEIDALVPEYHYVGIHIAILNPTDPDRILLLKRDAKDKRMPDTWQLPYNMFKAKDGGCRELEIDLIEEAKWALKLRASKMCSAWSMPVILPVGHPANETNAPKPCTHHLATLELWGLDDRVRPADKSISHYCWATRKRLGTLEMDATEKELALAAFDNQRELYKHVRDYYHFVNGRNIEQEKISTEIPRPFVLPGREKVEARSRSGRILRRTSKALDS